MAIRDAVAAIFVHQDRIFAVRRQPHLRAFPGYHAFPGGKVDRGESETPIEEPIFNDFPPRLMHALIREMREELDFDLVLAAQKGQIMALSELSEVTTPDFHSIRFRTHFFKITLDHLPRFLVDADEVAEHGWFTPAQLVERFHAGRLLVAPPLLTMIQALAADISCAHVPNAPFIYDPDREIPVMEALSEVWHLLVPSNTLPPADRTNAFVIGGYLLDPSPRDRATLAKLEHTLTRFDLKGIFLTHHHADHHQFAPELARKLNLPIHLSEDTHQRLTGNKGKGYFRGIPIHHVRDGQVLTTWKDQEVVVHAVPGHDEGQMALAPRDLAWFIVGDLIQGIGTVVIAAPEGDMSKYFETLQKVIDLNPAVIIPSHGLALGTVYRLEKTLEHRRIREQQVLKYHQEGKTPKAMLKHIYPDLPLPLAPLALANIKSHLTKLYSDKRTGCVK